MLRRIADFFRFVSELFAAPFRLAGLTGGGAAYDKHGYFRFLKSRDCDSELFQLEGVPEETVDRALDIFCEAFDILPVQKYCLRPKDRIMKLYCAMVTGPYDEREMERLSQGLQAATGIALSERDMEQFDTLEDLVLWYHSQNGRRTEQKPDNSAEDLARV